MSKKCKMMVTSIIVIIVILIIYGFALLVYNFGVITPYFSLNGEDKMKIALNQKYKEQGCRAYYHFQSYQEEVKIVSNINENKLGNYKVTYFIPSLNIKKTRSVEVIDKIKPVITLKGNKEIYTFINNEYKEEGASASDNYDGDISEQIEIESHANIRKTGKYNVLYKVKDQSGNEQILSRKVVVCKDPMSTKLNYNYDEYDNNPMEWWFNKSKDHKRDAGALSNKELAKYNAYYIGENEKNIYLTFDEGGSDKTYIKQIAKLLDRYEIQGTFFLTRNFILSEKDFIRELVASGHVVGNHTRNHLNMATLANESSVNQFVEEVTSVEKAYMQVTGQEMSKVFRYPKGEASERTMKMLQDLGYKTFFWSHAYYDYGPQLSYEDAYKSMMDYYHNGAIYLMHPNNKGNYDALEDFLKEMLDKGYHFKTVEQIK